MIEKLGKVYMLPYPYTDASGSKIRPVVIVIESGEDYEVLYITTKSGDDTVAIDSKDFIDGSLREQSYIRLSKTLLFAKSIFDDSDYICTLSASKMTDILQRIVLKYEYIIEQIKEQQ